MPTEPNPLLKATRKLYNLLSKFNSVPVFRSDALTADLKAAQAAIKEADPAYTTDIVVKGVPATTKDVIKNIAYNKGITVSQMMRPCVSRILQIDLIPESRDRVEIKNVPIALKTQVEIKLRDAGKSLSEIMLQEMERIISETPAHLHVKRM